MSAEKAIPSPPQPKDWEDFDGPYKVKVCVKCGRQVNPHVDHHNGPSRFVHCAHGRKGLGKLQSVGWKTIETVPAQPSSYEGGGE